MSYTRLLVQALAGQQRAEAESEAQRAEALAAESPELGGLLAMLGTALEELSTLGLALDEAHGGKAEGHR